MPRDVPKVNKDSDTSHRRLNLGCGRDYREGWINIDFNRGVRADLYLDLTESLPFDKSSITEVLLDNVLEHIPRARLFPFLDELHRVAKPGARLSIFVPHYSGMYALKHLAHHTYFGVGTFDLVEPEAPFNGERYSIGRFRVTREELLFFHHNLSRFKFLSSLPINWLFNFSQPWRQLMERFQVFGFDEIHYELEALKD